jgi:hypothetical protein
VAVYDEADAEGKQAGPWRGGEGKRRDGMESALTHLSSRVSLILWCGTWLWQELATSHGLGINERALRETLT